jgi:hypothetical protein
MSPTFRIRVTMRDSRHPILEMMHNDAVIGELSFLDAVEFATQAASVLRWYNDVLKDAKR